MKKENNKKQNLEAFDCKNCLNYEWWDEEVGYQCIYMAPPCDNPEWEIE